MAEDKYVISIFFIFLLQFLLKNRINWMSWHDNWYVLLSDPPPPPHYLTPFWFCLRLAVCHLSIELYYEIHFCEIKKNISVKTTFSFFLEMAILDAQVCQARQQPMRNSHGAIHMGCQACHCLVLPLATCFRTAWNSTQTETLWCFIRTGNGCLFSSCWRRWDYISIYLSIYLNIYMI